MTDELTYNIDVLSLYTRTLKRIHVDPRTTPAIRSMLDDVFKDGSSIYPMLVSGSPERIARQILELQKAADICGRILGKISDDPETPHATRAIITHALIQRGYMAKRRPIGWLSSADAKNEVAQRRIPPARRSAAANL